MSEKERPTKACFCPEPELLGDICVKCFGLDPKVPQKKGRRKIAKHEN